MIIRGVILHFGYVETSQVSPLILRYTGERPLRSVKQALGHLAHYLYEDYDNMYVIGEPSGEGYLEYLRQIPGLTASASPSFDGIHANCEEWWPWDTIHDILPILGNFVEIIEEAEWHLINALDLRRIKDKQFKNDILMLRETEKELNPDNILVGPWINMSS